ncbi:MAG: ATP12 family protein [Alphaproteobacteria bacterium]
MTDLEQGLKEISQNREVIIEKLLQFSLTDTLMFWGNEKDLIELQQQKWQPILTWAEKQLNLEIKRTQNLDVPEENKEAGYRIKNFLLSLDDKELTAFYKSALLMKSILLAMAFVKKEISAEQAFEAALLEERWQNKIWGTTDEAEENQEAFKQELIEIENFLK